MDVNKLRANKDMLHPTEFGLRLCQGHNLNEDDALLKWDLHPVLTVTWVDIWSLGVRKFDPHRRRIGDCFGNIHRVNINGKHMVSWIFQTIQWHSKFHPFFGDPRCRSQRGRGHLCHHRGGGTAMWACGLWLGWEKVGNLFGKMTLGLGVAFFLIHFQSIFNHFQRCFFEIDMGRTSNSWTTKNWTA